MSHDDQADGNFPSAFRLIVLGAGAGGGVPQWNCGCSICQQARNGNGQVTPRTQASIAVSADGEHWTLIDCAPEVQAQLQRTPELYPKALRHSPIERILLTGGDIDHIAGLLSLREGTPFELLATSSLHKTLSENSVFNVLAENVVSRTDIDLNTPITLSDGLSMTVFPVPGKAALYEPGEGDNIGAEDESTVGIELQHQGRKVFYIPGCARMTSHLAARLEGADVVLFDGTLWSNDELVKAGLGHKTGARMGHLSMSGDAGSMAALADIDIKRKVFIHINNSNPVLIENGVEHQQAKAAGWELAYDGMRISL